MKINLLVNDPIKYYPYKSLRFNPVNRYLLFKGISDFFWVFQSKRRKKVPFTSPAPGARSDGTGTEDTGLRRVPTSSRAGGRARSSQSDRSFA